MPEKAPAPMISDPVATWELANGYGVTTTIRVDHCPDWPDDTPPPQPADDRTVARHPYPNRFVLTVNERDEGATEAETGLNRAEATQLYQALGRAFMWDGQ